MKKLTTILMFFIIAKGSLAQPNALPPSGYVGIGTTNPEINLHVIGNSRFNGSGWYSRNSNGAHSDALYLGQLQGSDNPSVQISTSDDGGVNRSIWLSNRWSKYCDFKGKAQ